jgi:hypothetical protein
MDSHIFIERTSSMETSNSYGVFPRYYLILTRTYDQMNVVLCKDGTAQLCDFGLSRLIDGTTSEALKGHGTCRLV